MNRRQFLTVSAATMPLVAGCTGGGDSQQQQQGGGDGKQADKTITMKNTAFQTVKAEVETDMTVKWVNEDGFDHTVTSASFHEKAKSWSLDEQVSGGDSITHTFDETGVYEYYCTIHGKSRMCGAVLVGGATLDEDLPCSDGDDAGYY